MADPTIERLVKSVAGPDYRVSNWPDGTEGFKSSGDREARFAVYVVPRRTANAGAKVMHVYMKPDMLASTFNRPFDSRYFVEQSVHEYDGKVMTLRNFVELLSELRAPERIPFESVRAYLRGVLTALSVIHEDGRFHGDLRPENVSIGADESVKLVDYQIRVPWTMLPTDRKWYVAPELRQGERRGSPSGDIYSFGRLATELLRPFRGDQSNPSAAKLERQLSWLADFCFVCDPDDRPSARAVRDALIEVPPRHDEALKDVILDAHNVLKREGLDERTGPFRQGPPGSSLSRLMKDVDAFPETGFALKSLKTARRLAMWLSIDPSHRGLGQVPGGVSTIEPNELSLQIDDRWLNALHRSHYGFGIDRDHDGRIKTLALSDEDRERDHFYVRHVGLSNEARTTLIDSVSFMHTRDVVDFMSQSEVQLGRAEILTMRQWGDILAVPDHDRWLYPAFQFDPVTAMPSPLVRTVHDALRLASGVDEDEWTVLSFWAQPRTDLDGASLAEVLWLGGARKLVNRELARRGES